ncbi:GTP-binding protein [Jiangella alkaliphila]|uniref:CobW/HypB/UreG, nucleotide-binding domain n=1 Tax=Jiangella alkaliphila TaxID=419479 RepID=A0A1H2LGM0_9ACTN|nr:GTP-binding protein [Jiangella alkaliphila]SDU79982.1 CobW/HypB/UreG, nucleotide-binding domain [Jiangella alkaliphila]
MSTRFIAVSGFLGAGKTTTLGALARTLQARGRRVAVVTNDQGEQLVDTKVAAVTTGDVAEVTGGCFCCRFEDLETVVSAAIERGADTVLAEAVGSCTDLQATVVRPLRARYGAGFTVAPLVAVVDPLRHGDLGRSLGLSDERSDLAYLYDRQLADADVVAINKIDLTRPGETGRIRADLRRRCPHALVLEYSAVTGEGLAALGDVLTGDGGGVRPRDLGLDYDRYAAAEARLAWLNHALRLDPAGAAPVPPARWGEAALTHLGASAARHGWTVGHAKVAIDTGGRITKLSLVDAARRPVADLDASPYATAAPPAAGVRVPVTAVLNARIACRPHELDAAVTAAVAAADAATGTVSTADAGPPSSFAPSYPTPTHRLPATAGA